MTPALTVDETSREEEVGDHDDRKYCHWLWCIDGGQTQVHTGRAENDKGDPNEALKRIHGRLCTK